MTTRQKENVLRSRATPAELDLYRHLALHPATSGKFKFQACCRGYYVDFLCEESKLIVELDGACHSGAKAKSRDAKRTQRLMKSGYRVVRFWNGQVERAPEKVLAGIVNEMGWRRVTQ